MNELRIIQELMEKVSDLERKMDNVVVDGEVEEVEGNRVRVRISEDYLTNPVPFLAGNSGDFRKPKKGDTVRLIRAQGNPLGGVVAGVIPKTGDKKEGDFYKEFEDGTKISYSEKSGQLNVAGKKLKLNIEALSLSLKTSGNASIESKGAVSVKGSQILLDKKEVNKGVVSCDYPCQITGLPHGLGSAVVKVGR